jgi:hypothetical protein
MFGGSGSGPDVAAIIPNCFQQVGALALPVRLCAGLTIVPPSPCAGSGTVASRLLAVSSMPAGSRGELGMAVADMPPNMPEVLSDVMPPDDAPSVKPDVSEQVGRKPLRSVAFGVSSNCVPVLPAGTPRALVPRAAVPSAVLPDEEIGVEIIELPGEELALVASMELDDVGLVSVASVEADAEELALVAAVEDENASPEAEVLDCATPHAPEASLVPAVVRIDIEELSSGAPEAPDDDVVVVGELDGIIIPPPSKVDSAAVFAAPLLQGMGLPMPSP